ncbi:ABC transporter ATP-binding protein [Paracoccus shanxieyensis]|uniref:ATP-binding cassette domain-containing protein n=1 Tax=Paracoccus shanxieyensis TaxID=2675752 RepID=A0A6L6IUX2_9RHOB|nr:ABC transporter ATP-binding protein [Paracoccus shanxieyensis]MTH64305.1 ATP-binding cassette domain-containing protein [Paracoccus shanxieyensis]MTH87449.1 ATP-binding cassette domain-containing protein [Paracoccus shanxieyensis]
MQDDAGVTCTALGKTYPGGVAAVQSVTLQFAAGQTTALVGPSGCGKSTLLRLIAGLERPDSGTVRIAGLTPAQARRQGVISVAFQDPSLLPWLDAARNVALARKLARQPPDPQRVAQLLDLVGLQGFAATRPAAMSGGMRQRTAIARALVTAPQLLLLDEPFGAVDELTRRQLARDLPSLWQGATTVLVTHSVDEAVLLAHRIIVLSARPARIVADIAVPLSHPRSPDLTETPAFRQIAAHTRAALALPQPT